MNERNTIVDILKQKLEEQEASSERQKSDLEEKLKNEALKSNHSILKLNTKITNLQKEVDSMLEKHLQFKLEADDKIFLLEKQAELQESDLSMYMYMITHAHTHI
jgi:hypothetical protein